MLNIGCHLTISNGYLSAAKEAKSIGANTFQYFSRNPRGGSARAVDKTDITAFNEFCKENNFAKIVAHAPYTLNLASDKESVRDFAKRCMIEDLTTMQLMNGNYYNFHPGSHVGQGEDIGLQHIIKALNEILSPQQNTIVLLEMMSGKGSELGVNFEQIKFILDNVEQKDKIGVLIDTCHVYSYGYDIVSNLDAVLQEFDSVIGIDKLKAIHLNDSMTPFASKKDRHEVIGAGSLGLDAIVNFINNKYIKNLPICLETPNTVEGYQKEIALLKSLYK